MSHPHEPEHSWDLPGASGAVARGAPQDATQDAAPSLPTAQPPPGVAPYPYGTSAPPVGPPPQGYAQPGQNGYGQPGPNGYGYGYGQPGRPSDGHPGYGQAPYGQQGGYGAAPEHHAPASTVVLLVVSGVFLLLTFWTGAGLLFVAPVTLAIIGLTRAHTHAASTRRLTRTGWVVFGVVTALTILVAVLAVEYVLSRDTTDTGYSALHHTLLGLRQRRVV